MAEESIVVSIREIVNRNSKIIGWEWNCNLRCNQNLIERGIKLFEVVSG